MKILVLVRHAKSSWKDVSLNDLERPLKKSGARKAALMVSDFKLKKLAVPELIISSHAKRALDTAKIFARAFRYKTSEILIDELLYESNKQNLLKAIYKTPDKTNTVFIFGHDPSLTELFNALTKTNKEEIPTSGIACLKIDCKKWKEISRKKAEIAYFSFPKNLKLPFETKDE